MSGYAEIKKKIFYLKELETVEAAKAKEAEIKELKRIIEKGNQERKNLENIIAMTDERNETLSDTVAKFSEKYLRSHKQNYVLGVCLVLIIIGSGLIIFLQEGLMFYKISDIKRECDRIYSVEKINYITREGNEIKVFYNSWSNELTLGSDEEAEEFILEMHKLLNKKGLFRQILDLLIQKTKKWTITTEY